MEDAKYINVCNHYLISEELTIEKVEGNDKLFRAKLPHPALTNKALTFIRTYNDEQNYINSKEDYTKVINYSYVTLDGSTSSLPEAGIIKAIGITNYEFVSENEIVFGVVQNDSTIEKIKIDDGIFPKNKYLIDYYVKQDNCPLCLGNGYVNDINFDGTGALMKATGTQKLIQRVIKTLLTRIGNQSEDYLYGSSLDDLIGATLDNTTLVTIQKSIYEAVNYLMEIQSGQSLDKSETVLGVTSIVIEENKTNPSMVDISITIKDGYGYEQPCVISLKVN